MMEFFQFQVPTRIVGGEPGFLQTMAPELATFTGMRAAVITDAVICTLPAYQQMLTSLEESNIQVVASYQSVPQDSDVQVVHTVRDSLRPMECELLIAIGGGSVMDTAKAVNIVLTHAGDLLEYQGAHILTEPLLPLIVIPTTVGTGSEVTMVSVIADATDHRKLTFVDYRLAPTLAVLDPAVTFSLPKSLVAATAMDALTHAIEAFIDVEHSPFSDLYAVEAARIIREQLLCALDDHGYEEARTHLQMAATMAGIAFNHSMVGIVHALAHALGGVSRVPHGVANSLMLVEGLQFNMEEVPERIAEIGVRAGFVDVQNDVQATAKAAIVAIAQLRADVCAKSGIASTLSAAGVSYEQIPLLVERASEDGSLLYNPRMAEENDLLKMYEHMMK